MAKSLVLQALGILGLQDILKLTEVLRKKQGTLTGSLKKVAGDELNDWNNETKKTKKDTDAKVLNFPKKTLLDFEYPTDDGKEEDKEGGPKVTPAEVVLWQREMAKESSDAIQKMDAMKGYRRSTEMYVVKSQSDDGKEKIHFASTNGILVNKKQA